MIRLSLRTRLAIWFAASIFLILAPCLIGVLMLEWRQMRAALDHHLEEDLEVALLMLVRGSSGVAWRTETDVDPGYDAGVQRWVEVYGLDGDPIFFRGFAASPAIRAALPTASLDAPGPRTFTTPSGAYVRALSVERRIGDTPLQIRVVRAEDGLRRDLRNLILLFSIATPLAILSGALAGYVISGRALTPLARMAERARLISAQRLSERLPVENPDDELGQLAVVFNKTFARLEDSFGRLKQFTADVSHELRTPLTAIRSVGEVGLRKARDPRDYEEVIGSMLEETDRLSSVVETLLTLSRWESGRTPTAAEPVDLCQVAREVAAQLSVLAEERRIEIDLALDRPLMVSSDRIMVRQAVINVLDNAIKFTPEGGRVRIVGGSSDQDHQLVVDDEGPGIPADQRTRVLEPFYRFERGRGPSPAGAGLGLTIVRRAMEANRGRVVIDSNEAGGARLVLVLPRHVTPRTS